MFGAEPITLDAQMELDPVFGTDRLTSAVLDFGRGTATVTCSTQLAPHQSVSVHGSTGRIELELPFNPPADTPTRIRLYRDRAMQEITVEPCDQFRVQADYFAEAVMHGNALPVPLADSLANMIALDHAARPRLSKH